MKLLTALLKNQGPQIQGIILVSPMGEFLISALYRTLSRREFIALTATFFVSVYSHRCFQIDGPAGRLQRSNSQ